MSWWDNDQVLNAAAHLDTMMLATNEAKSSKSALSYHQTENCFPAALPPLVRSFTARHRQAVFISQDAFSI